MVISPNGYYYCDSCKFMFVACGRRKRKRRITQNKQGKNT
jgi:hypothetical protein